METSRCFSAVQWDCCARERACFNSGEMHLLSWKYDLDFGVSILQNMTLEGLLCSCSFLLCLSQFLPAGPSGVHIFCICCSYSCIRKRIAMFKTLNLYKIPIIYTHFYAAHTPSLMSQWGIYVIIGKILAKLLNTFASVQLFNLYSACLSTWL